MLHEIGSIAYVVADVMEGKEEARVLHQTYDVCEEGNVGLVRRQLSLAFSEVGMLLRPLISGKRAKNRITDDEAGGGDYVLRLRDGIDAVWGARIKELVHGYMVAVAVAAWLGLTLPGKADEWRRRREELSAELEDAATRLAVDVVHPSATLTRRPHPF